MREEIKAEQDLQRAIKIKVSTVIHIHNKSSVFEKFLTVYIVMQMIQFTTSLGPFVITYTDPLQMSYILSATFDGSSLSSIDGKHWSGVIQ